MLTAQGNCIVSIRFLSRITKLRFLHFQVGSSVKYLFTKSDDSWVDKRGVCLAKIKVGVAR